MTDRLERLINLVIALRETRRPMTAADIRERVAGYGQPDPEAFRRMFERDKADLRGLGVPVDTVALDAFGDRLAYRIDPRRYDLPEVTLQPDELAALAVALQATGLAEEARPALLKLQVGAGGPGEPDPPQPRLGVALDAPHRQALMEAQLNRTTVRFAYRPLGRDVDTRTVDPHALVHRRGRWYLVGHDHGRGQRRAFRLDRIAGTVRTVGAPGAFALPPEALGVDDVVPAPPPDVPQSASVVVAPAVAWQVARRARGEGRPLADDDRRAGWTRFSVSVGDPDDFCFWALQFGPDLVVEGPPQVRAAVLARLERLVS